MGSLYRSVEMCRCQLFLQTDAAYQCVAELGELGLTMFRDLNPDVTSFQRNFVNEVRRCAEMERQLRFIEKEITRENIDIVELDEYPDCPKPSELANLQATLEKVEQEIIEMNNSAELLQQNYTNLLELKHILYRAQLLFPEAAHARQQLGEIENIVYSTKSLDTIESSKLKQEHMDLNYIVGTVNQSKVVPFERVIWRATRGNIFLRLAEIEDPILDPKSREFVHKQIFLVFFQGEHLRNRINKIIEGFGATSYDVPATPEERQKIYEDILVRLEDLKLVVGQTTEHRMRILTNASQNVRTWFSKVWKMKGVYHTMNSFNLDVTQKCLIAECWLPNDDFDKVQAALHRGTENGGGMIPSILTRIEANINDTLSQNPPTWFRTNKFTEGFQNLVESYGVACYREVNPAPFTIITFPFLFAIMFGDFCHGLLMFLFALFLVVKEKYLEKQKIRDEIFTIFFSGRYIILSMGLFSLYTGLIYNDFFSKSINLFGSGWRMDYSDETIQSSETRTLDPADNKSYLGQSYPFGIDPIWNIAANKLTYLNSFKMKMSVIVGILQMLFGVLLSFANYKYFKSPLDIFAVFIPQVLFISSIFVYLCGLIFYKWIIFGASPILFPLNLPYDNTSTLACNPNQYLGTNCAPSLLIGLINMFMFSEGKPGFCGTGCSEGTFYPNQAMIQHGLVVLAVICIPWMLLVKPFVIRHRHEKKVEVEMSKRALIDESTGEEEVNGVITKETKNEDFDFSEVFIHQAIHTIEYCLGCVSHTASYLRLWALSLAHAELSEVLWSMVMSFGFQMKGAIGGVAIYAIFWAFAGITISVLLVMEGLSAFLHALRLHWVEFQSKFYIGDGYPFQPFSFAIILKECEELLYTSDNN